MTVVVTCGPAWEPLDGMRRLTNASTGRLGTTLADRLADNGHRVLVLRGDGSTAPPPRNVAQLRPFGTNDDLAQALNEIGRREPVDAILHAAALCDFRLRRALDAGGSELRTAKIPSRSGVVHLELEPATKVLPRLRDAFPRSRLVGWKYELEGTREQAIAAARRQLLEARTDACVLNGTAWGPGFAWCETNGHIQPLRDAASLADHLLAWLTTPGRAGAATD